VVECCPCPVFASFTLAFALQLRKKHGETSVGEIPEEGDKTILQNTGGFVFSDKGHCPKYK
jgi:hypothetical protein